MVVLRLSKALAEGEPRLPAVSRVRATARPLEERSGSLERTCDQDRFPSNPIRLTRAVQELLSQPRGSAGGNGSPVRLDARG